MRIAASRPFGRGLRMIAGCTAKQAECLAFITGHIARHPASPSYTDIGEALGIASRSEIHRLVHALKARGHITFEHGRARSIALVQRACPHCGGALDVPPIHTPLPKPKRVTGYHVRDIRQRRRLAAMRAEEAR